MGTFRFKRFNVVNEKSAMKVNTDGVLLGAAMTIRPEDRDVLDVGTGTGTIALMAAQRLWDMNGGTNAGFRICGIDIDPPSAEEAAENFGNSDWAGFMEAVQSPLSGYRPGGKFDLICSNPPFFDNSLEAPEERRNNARHTCSLSFRELSEFAAEYLKPDGRLSMILPADSEKAALRYSAMNGLYPFSLLRISTVPWKKASRIIMELSRTRYGLPEEKAVSIHDISGNYSKNFELMTSMFYL